jgi:ribonuclease HII
MSSLTSVTPTSNKCIADNSPIPVIKGSDPFKISKAQEINELFEHPKIKSQLGDLLDCFWCEHGQTINRITDCKILQLETLEKAFLPSQPVVNQVSVTAVNHPMVIVATSKKVKLPMDAEITIRKENCGCRGSLLFTVSDILNANTATIKSRTTIYPIPFRKKDIIEVGVDEAGRGCLFGPVTAGAVIWPPDLDDATTRRLIKDSKKLTEAQREEAYAYITENAVSWGVASLDNKEIDNTNILRAAIKAMHLAIDETYVIPTHILVDGDRFIVYNDRKGEPVSYSTVVQGDSKYYSIAAASIIAKVTRDRAMVQLEKDYPELERYGIGSNKGYGAEVHLEAIKTYGVTQWHRRSFSPCK